MVSNHILYCTARGIPAEIRWLDWPASGPPPMRDGRFDLPVKARIWAEAHSEAPEWKPFRLRLSRDLENWTDWLEGSDLEGTVITLGLDVRWESVPEMVRGWVEGGEWAPIVEFLRERQEQIDREKPPAKPTQATKAILREQRKKLRAMAERRSKALLRKLQAVPGVWTTKVSLIGAVTARITATNGVWRVQEDRRIWNLYSAQNRVLIRCGFYTVHLTEIEGPPEARIKLKLKLDEAITLMQRVLPVQPS